MRQVVTTLLPSVSFSGVSTESEAEAENRDVDIRLTALTKLQEIFGVSEFERMDSVLKGCLLQAEMYWQIHFAGASDALNGNPVDASPVVNSLYAACQCAFRPFLVGGDARGFTIEGVSRKSDLNGLGKLPDSLRTVGERMLQRTLAGDDQTLGACVVVWIFVSDDNLLRRMAIRHPNFLGDIAWLLDNSKHANQICQMKTDVIRKQRKAIYTLVKNIMKERDNEIN